MLILIDFVDFESSVEYYNNYKSNESVHHTKAPPPRHWHPQIESPTQWQKKAFKGPGVPGDVGWLPVSLIPASFRFIPFFLNKFEYFPVLLL